MVIENTHRDLFSQNFVPPKLAKVVRSFFCQSFSVDFFLTKFLLIMSIQSIPALIVLQQNRFTSCRRIPFYRNILGALELQKFHVKNELSVLDSSLYITITLLYRLEFYHLIVVRNFRSALGFSGYLKNFSLSHETPFPFTMSVKIILV